MNIQRLTRIFVVLILFEGGTQLDYFNENHEIILECLGDDYEEFYD